MTGQTHVQCPDMSRYVQSDRIRISWYMLAVEYVSNIWGCDCHPDQILQTSGWERQSANVLTQADMLDGQYVCWTHVGPFYHDLSCPSLPEADRHYYWIQRRVYGSTIGPQLFDAILLVTFFDPYYISS